MGGQQDWVWGMRIPAWGLRGEAQLQKGRPEVGAERAMGVTAGGEPAR